MAASARKPLPPGARGLSVYYEVDAGPYGAGTASFMGEILARLGAKNIVPAELGPFPKLNPEFIVKADPDLIIVAQQEALALKRRPGWRQLTALASGRVCGLAPKDYDLMAIRTLGDFFAQWQRRFKKVPYRVIIYRIWPIPLHHIYHCRAEAASTP